jgi:hypothetical protein
MYKRLWMFVSVLTLLCGFASTQYVYADNDQPRVMVTGYELVGEGLSQGEDNLLTFTLKNMNATYPVYSVLITFESSDPHVHPKYGASSQAYIDSIPASGEKKAVIPLEVANGLEGGYLNSVINISYQDDARGVTSTRTDINLPILQDYLKILRVYIPETVVLNVKSRVSVTFENIKNEEMYNTVMTVKGSGMDDAKVELGTVFSGSRKSQEIYISFSSTGMQNISVAFSYCDTQGIKYTTETQNYQVKVIPKVTGDVNASVANKEIKFFNININTTRILQLSCILAILLCFTGIAIEIRRERSVG